MNGEWTGVIGAAAGALATESMRLAGRLRRGQLAAARRSGEREVIDAQKLRDELWVEINKLRDRLDEVSAELERARMAYIELLGKYTELHAEHKALEREHADLKATVDRKEP